MTFDEQLRRTFDTLTDRLHDNIRREVQIAVDEAMAVELPRVADDEASQRLLEAVRARARAQSLGDTLDTLTTCAAREAGRTALLTVQGRRVHGWRFIGFGPLDRTPALDLSLESTAIIADAVRANAIMSGRSAPPFAELPSDAWCIALPIALADEVVAVLYADGGASSAVNAAALEILTRYAARSIEAVTAFKVARSLTAPSPASQPLAAPAEEDEEAAARRYARLLVSEIKLYHEDSVAAGRRDRDLTVRLGGEISRARMLYEQRVPPHVRQRAHYFEDELVRTLANGDASLVEMT
jgi:hypothetical protein